MKKTNKVKALIFGSVLFAGHAMANLTFYNDTNIDIQLSSNNGQVHKLISGTLKPNEQRYVKGNWLAIRSVTHGKAFILGASSGLKHESASIQPHRDSGEVTSISGGDFLIAINDSNQAAAKGTIIPENSSIHIRLP